MDTHDTAPRSDLARLLLAGTPTAQVDAAIRIWQEDRELDPASIRRLGDLLQRFASRLQATGVGSVTDATEEDCDGFLWARTRRSEHPSIATVHLRRSTLRALYRTISGVRPDTVDPTRKIVLPPKHRAATRPLRDEEISLLRIAALGRTRGAQRTTALLALAEATGTTGEIPQVLWRHVDLPRGRVQLPGAHPVQPRTAQLTEWGTSALQRLADGSTAAPGESITYQGRFAPDSHQAQAQTSSRLRRLLADAGLTEGGVVPTSIRLWQPARRLTTGTRIEDVAVMLGLQSLDSAAAALGHEWRRS